MLDPTKFNASRATLLRIGPAVGGMIGMRTTGSAPVVCVSVATFAGSLELLNLGRGGSCEGGRELVEAVVAFWTRLAPTEASAAGRCITGAGAMVVVEVSVPASAGSLVVLSS